LEKALVVKDISKKYRGSSVFALDKFNLTVENGRIYGLLGPNGAGKTTAISIITTLLKPTGGTISIFGVDARKHPDRIKKFIGLVPQNIAIYEKLTVSENLHYFGSLYDIQGKKLKTRIEYVMELMGLSEYSRMRIGQCSGGIKRRANLAAGILHKPDLLFLDEPTTGIDPQSRNNILNNLKELEKEKITIIYTTHHMEEAETLCSDIAIMDNGRIIAEGKPAELIKSGNNCKNLEELFISLTGKYLRD